MHAHLQDVVTDSAIEAMNLEVRKTQSPNEKTLITGLLCAITGIHIHAQLQIVFAGSAIEAMNMEERMTICNMVVEAGGKNGVIAADATTFDYVKSRTDEPFEAVYSDSNASFIEEYR